MLVAAPARDYSLTVMMAVSRWTSAGAREVRRAFEQLEARAAGEMAVEGYEPASLTFHRTADMRYRGQSHELQVALPDGNARALPALFHAAHEGRYGYSRPEAMVEIVNVRVQAVAAVVTPALPEQPVRMTRATPRRTKSVWFDGGLLTTACYPRSALPAGSHFRGPAVIFQYDTTTVVPPQWQGAVDRYGNLLLTLAERDV
jgi:N-methylhydantoinase A